MDFVKTPKIVVIYMSLEKCVLKDLHVLLQHFIWSFELRRKIQIMGHAKSKKETSVVNGE